MAQHVLQDCRLYSNVTQSIWRERVDMHTKLYEPLPEQEKTVAFIVQAGIRSWRERRKTRRRRKKKIFKKKKKKNYRNIQSMSPAKFEEFKRKKYISWKKNCNYNYYHLYSHWFNSSFTFTKLSLGILQPNLYYDCSLWSKTKWLLYPTVAAPFIFHKDSSDKLLTTGLNQVEPMWISTDL